MTSDPSHLLFHCGPRRYELSQVESSIYCLFVYKIIVLHALKAFFSANERLHSRSLPISQLREVRFGEDCNLPRVTK